ncbi:hypothetical protein [Patulibacter sp.]|uniref:hypothetical protein n=1 Tax=Patulibacter sp. TaxID=1912859 RepID=UPI0027159A6B|nr:hypothetical protein [Patulibacter sp.]MDO9409415.1 hypothetical protein [Patulibacter sp.]
MSDETVTAHFHGGPFDGGSLPVAEADVHDLVALEPGADGPRLSGPLAEGDDHDGRDVYRLSPAASGLEGDVEYAYEAPLEAD